MIHITQILVSLCLLIQDTGSNEIELVRNDQHVITYECQKDRIDFKIDVIGDMTDDTKAKYPNLDYYFIWVDFNNNGKLDSLMDLNFSPIYIGEELQVCKSLLYGRYKQSTCYLNSNSTCSSQFKPTKNSSIEHVVFQMSIPTKELSNSDEYSVYFMIADKYSKTHYPQKNRAFEKTFKLECKKVSI